MESTNLLKALVKAKPNFGRVKKDAKNPHFKNTYATLAAVLEAVEIPLAEQGIVIVHQLQEDGLRTAIVHCDSGEELDFHFPLTLGANPQAIGSGLTYARRYSLLCLLSLAAEDDDGEEARQSPAPAKAKTEAKAEEPEAKVLIRAHWQELAASLKQDFGAEFPAGDVAKIIKANYGEGAKAESLTLEQAQEVCKLLEIHCGQLATQATWQEEENHGA